MAFEPLVALSIATAVIQFVDFGTKLISKGKELYESADGVLADHAEVAAVSSRLVDLTKGLSASVEISTTKQPSPAEIALRQVSLDCQGCAAQFILAIDDLRVPCQRRKWKSFRQALKSVWKEKGIEEQMIKLDRLRQLVIVHLLVVVKYVHLVRLRVAFLATVSTSDFANHMMYVPVAMAKRAHLPKLLGGSTAKKIKFEMVSFIMLKIPSNNWMIWPKTWKGLQRSRSRSNPMAGPRWNLPSD